jgi:hypothetical protein
MLEIILLKILCLTSLLTKILKIRVYIIIILSAVLCKYETWSLTLGGTWAEGV